MKKQMSDSKRGYSTPQLTVHGTVEELTQLLETGTPDAPTGGGGTTLG